MASTDTELAYWIVDLAAAGGDCRDHLARVGDLVASQPKDAPK